MAKATPPEMAGLSFVEIAALEQKRLLDRIAELESKLDAVRRVLARIEESGYIDEHANQWDGTYGEPEGFVHDLRVAVGMEKKP